VKNAGPDIESGSIHGNGRIYAEHRKALASSEESLFVVGGLMGRDVEFFELELRPQSADLSQLLSI
jgi:hypothetical protein